MSERVYVDDADNFEDGDRHFVDYNGSEVCVLYLDEEFHAFLNHCPHRGGPVARGEIMPGIDYEENEHGEPPKERYNDCKIITCPWHGWDFEVDTGIHSGTSGGAHRLTKFDVEVESGNVYIRS
ncbi:Rieske 2Fe-2S domain-containing protein [Halobellus sp. GM3]|uniref:Rieske 2Fe-2S domain-containing protein n=1 Tax=Halobellus sp. GM3 TaxID=3458410 RepID=UPI00403D5AA9